VCVGGGGFGNHHLNVFGKLTGPPQ